VLDVAILGLLVEGDLHGYELKKRLSELMGPWSSVSFGSLYPALSRLERQALVATVTDPAPDAGTPPMSGSLGAELAAFRRDRTPRRGGPSRRARKVYAITDSGRAALLELLVDASGDERAFAIRVAFCRLLEPADRLGLFSRRREGLVTRAAGRGRVDARGDLYRRSLFEFQDDRLRREVAWVDELIASTSAEPALDPDDARPGAPESSDPNHPNDSLIPGGSPT
jgi:DNA-binding PadR family transcriptional regulator